MLLSARQIEVIHAVIGTGSVTDAADLLGVSQPAVSMTLRECNQLVGFPLFERLQGRMQPTQETLLLVPELEKIVAGMHHIDRLIGDLRESSIGHVRLAAAPLLADTIVPLALATFKRERLQLSLTTAHAEDVLAQLNDDKADLGLSIAAGRSESDLVIDIGQTELVCILPRGHILADRPFVDCADIAAYPVITFSRGLPLGEIVAEAFRRVGCAYDIACEVSSTSTACALVEQNIGIALVPAIGLSAHRQVNIVAREFRPHTPISAQLLLPRHGRISRAARRLVRTLRAVGREVLLQPAAIEREPAVLGTALPAFPKIPLAIGTGRA